MLTFRVLLLMVCACAILPLSASQTILAAAASTLFEGTPFILAGALLSTVAPRLGPRAVAFLGCGCGPGPSARSLPAAAATLLVFGPVVAGARLAAAVLIARLLKRPPGCAHPAPLRDLQTLLPVALANGAFVALAMPIVQRLHPSPGVAFALGAVAAFVASPCALGAVGFAAMLHATIPAASAGFLCVAGIADVRALLLAERHGGEVRGDRVAFALLAAACAFVAVRHGAALVHPRFAIALAACAVLAIAAMRFSASSATMRVAPAVMLAGAVIGAPLPSYSANATTLADAYAGEALVFRGVADATTRTITRFAITCCRADAVPVSIRVQTPLHERGWVEARGTLVEDARGLALRATSIESITAPSDPFLYR